MRRSASTGVRAGRSRARRSAKGRRTVKSAAKSARRRAASAVELRKQLAEALEQQAATSEVLQVISNSPGDLTPVFNAMLAYACRICEAKFGTMFRFDGDRFYPVAELNAPPAISDFVRRRGRFLPEVGSALDTVWKSKRTLHTIDDTLSRVTAPPTRLVGARTHLAVPMLKGTELVGIIIIYRQEVRPFTEKQIALVTGFAAQAVIAIENVRLFEEIQETSRRLAEASQHKSQFLANMSHELRTPLNAILGYTELILDGIYGETPERAQEVLKRVESNGKHLLGLINDVLDLSKIEAGQLKLTLSEYSMTDVVNNIFSAVEPLATKKKLNVKVDVPPNIPAGHGDERRLSQVLLNLVSNAIKFTDSGEVAIKVAAGGNGSISVAVHDTGPGIAPADQEKVFEEFQQADNSITKSKGGTGLGLAISRRIIELHGGRLWLESRLGSGSVFTFTVPNIVTQQASPP